MRTIRITRTARLPDPIRISRFRKAPELGPAILFFSGGTALKGVSRILKNYTFNSVHLVTPFDSGGSSAKLRHAFRMPAIGDLRSRLMTLADETITGHPDVYRLFTYRFPADGPRPQLQQRLAAMVKGKEPMVARIPNPMRRLIRTQLGYFQEAMPKGFVLAGASIGNLILTGGYLNNHKHLDPIIFLFSKLVNVQGVVRAVVNNDLHLGADLEDGHRVVGQHLLTGKEAPPLKSPIRRLFLCDDNGELPPSGMPTIRKKTRRLIEKADLICFPPGSYYSSLIAQFLPRGVGAAVAANDNPKIYVPGLGTDPEQIGMTLDQTILKLLEQLRKDTGQDCPTQRLMNFILMDSKHGNYSSPLNRQITESLGIQIIDTDLVTPGSPNRYNPEWLAAALLSLC
ncbi:MAG: GAK system CofD-like protein [Gammaproteobacteria bacterium]|nr:GAK system CofD-like protein [Gammaproteobacteria bacterium]